MKSQIVNISVLSNQFTLLQADWLTIPYGDHPHSQGIQRLTNASAKAMAGRFHSMRGKLARMFGGLPFFVGHPDDPAFANESTDKRAYGWIMDMQAREDGLAIQVKWNELGNQAISNAEYKWFSPRWAVKQIGSINGKDLFDPQWLISAGLTNRPNIGVMPLSNEDMSDMSNPSATQMKGVSKPMKDALIKLLGLANEATDEQILSAIAQKATADQAAAMALANEKTAHAYEKTLCNAAQVAQTTAETTLANERTARTAKEAELQAEIGKQKKARIDMVLANAIAAGKITEAQKPQWAADLDKDLDGKITELSNAQPIVKTASTTGDLGGRNSETVSRQDKILTLVNEKTAKGMDYDAAWAAVKKANPALFEEPKRKEG
ncbi:MAG: hypothetical protein NT011_13510 [Kiritimatiellaeota bacterium]|nr:hypothetical protein [Kiritimatiellota bacterium]